MRRLMRRFFKEKKRSTTTTPSATSAPTVPTWLAQVINDLDRWEISDPDHLRHAFEGYLDELYAPILAEEELHHLASLRGRQVVQQTVELAPDLFDKALQAHPLETGYF